MELALLGASGLVCLLLLIRCVQVFHLHSTALVELDAGHGGVITRVANPVEYAARARRWRGAAYGWVVVTALAVVLGVVGSHGWFIPALVGLVAATYCVQISRRLSEFTF